MADWGHSVARWLRQLRIGRPLDRGYQADPSGSFDFGSTGRVAYGLFCGKSAIADPCREKLQQAHVDLIAVVAANTEAGVSTRTDDGR